MLSNIRLHENPNLRGNSPGTCILNKHTSNTDTENSNTTAWDRDSTSFSCMFHDLGSCLSIYKHYTHSPYNSQHNAKFASTFSFDNILILETFGKIRTFSKVSVHLKFNWNSFQKLYLKGETQFFDSYKIELMKKIFSV